MTLIREVSTNLYMAKIQPLFPVAFRHVIVGVARPDNPVQRPLARLRVMLSRWVIAYYGLIRDPQSSLCLIFFVQKVFALRSCMDWY